ncbi:ATP-binding protein [Campylobacter sp. RM13119]|uniref:ATP-binding protein n=1 Tax=Campylobacter TaxID=194 RepID=UPI001473B450|nr:MULTISPECIES: ATP-binding protein [unclassified Campylobacter]MBE3606762.1 ATP-binding protein [Campylobacter sp. RM13119]MBE3610357.1 ATP-binding protein [Campylobacter sp. RM12916]
MKDLDFFYHLPLKSIKFIARKEFISSAKTLILGYPGSGKTSLILDALDEYKQEEKLYINLKDLRINADTILANLIEFLKENQSIKILAIDNATTQDQMQKLSQISELEKIIISTNNKTLTIPNFRVLHLEYLDYEEFMLFFRKNISPEAFFSHFLAHGTSVANTMVEPSETAQITQNKLRAELSQTNLQIIKECAKKCAETISAHEIYKILKERIKISKDSVYAGLIELENNGFIKFLSKFNEPNAAKKLFFNDFSVRNALNLKKDFNANFSNIVFCELSKFKDEIFYTNEFDFFLTRRKLAIICVPFTDSEIVFLKFKKLHVTLKRMNITRLQVISVANAGEITIEGIKCEILPFSRWALGI